MLKRILLALSLIIPVSLYAADGPFNQTVGYSTSTKTGTQVISGDLKLKLTTNTTAPYMFQVVGGSITQVGTVDGRDVSEDGSKLDAVAISTGSETAARIAADNAIAVSTTTEASTRGAADTALSLSTASIRTDLTSESNARIAVQISTWTAAAGYGISVTGNGTKTVAVTTSTLCIPAANIYPGALQAGVTAPFANNASTASYAVTADSLSGSQASSFANRADVILSTNSLQSQLNDLAVVSSTGTLTVPNSYDWNILSAVNIDTSTTPGIMTPASIAGNGGSDTYTYWRRGSNMSGNCYKIAMSADGRKQILARGSEAVISNDGGITWAGAGISWYAYGAAMSVDGSTITVVGGNNIGDTQYGNIQTSHDGGATWQQLETDIDWKSVAMSTNGVTQMAVTWGNLISNPTEPGRIFVSNDSGATWTQKAIGIINVNDSAMSYNGQIQMVLSISSGPIISTDFGETWAQKNSGVVANPYGCAMSVDGSTMTVAGSGKVYKSVDFGTSWTEIASIPSYAIAMSSGGRVMITGYNGGYMSYSKDWGVTWAKAIDLPYSWYYPTISQDGTIASVCEITNGYVYNLEMSSASYTSNVFNAGIYWYQWENFTTKFSSTSACNVQLYLRTGASTSTLSAYSPILDGESRSSAAGPYAQWVASFTMTNTTDIPTLSTTTLAYQNSQFFRKDLGINIGFINSTGTPSSETFLRGDGVWASTMPYANQSSTAAYAVSAATAAAVSASGARDGTKFLRDDYSWQVPAGGGGVVVSTYCPNIIHVGGDVFVASGTFNPIYGAIYRVQQSTWEITGLSFYNFGSSSVGSTWYNLAYSSSTGSTTTWEYVNSYNIEVTTNTKASGIIEVHKNIPPGSFLALHVTSIPASGTLPNEFGVLVRYKKVD